MEENRYETFEFKRPARIPRRVLWQVGLMIAVRLLWGMVAPQNYFWMVLIIVNNLGWMASYGWRMAILDLRTWIDRMTQEIE